ncbi:serine/threonine-protein kinase pim-3-like [Boleophthalmus pectinirostris]|uniref:serine/threonine-protein kinase pim-3-like n=1 Tax=Boleophthalmus pectinirostris TaxID=150288 RepID=UPI00242E37AD|nr:serine/threonine-protein kinase pim-3-like [Boleophthalmus pectinirostris]
MNSVGDLELRYKEHEQLGEGRFGSVFAGVRISDQQPVAIKHIMAEHVAFTRVSIKNEVFTVPSEVVLMTRAAPDQHSVGGNPSVTLLDWYLQDEGHKVILVMERPTPSQDLLRYHRKNAPLTEAHAKELIRQVVNALVDLHSKGVFHRDIKMGNLLVQATESGPRIRVIDFGCGSGDQSGRFYRNTGMCTLLRPSGLKDTALVLPQCGRRGRYFMNFCALKVPNQCSDFLQACLTLDPNNRIPLDQLSHHPWLSLV